jgi:HSP20 family protein
MRMVIPHSTGRLLNELSSDVNAFFESILGEELASTKQLTPPLDFEDRDDAYELTLDLPGLKADDIHIDVEEDHVLIHGTRQDLRQSGEAASGKPHRKVERLYGEFRRLVRLAKPVDKDAAVAHYENGVLSVTLPKLVKSGSRRIVVTPNAG